MLMVCAVNTRDLVGSRGKQRQVEAVLEVAGEEVDGGGLMWWDGNVTVERRSQREMEQSREGWMVWRHSGMETSQR